jgi:hypothetical protein
LSNQVLELKTCDDEAIENFHISPTAEFVAYLTGTKLRVYKLDISATDSGEILPKIRRVELVLKPKKVPHLLRFYRNNSTDFLLTATSGLGLKCYQMSPEDNSATPIFRLIVNSCITILQLSLEGTKSIQLSTLFLLNVSKPLNLFVTDEISPFSGSCVLI